MGITGETTLGTRDTLINFGTVHRSLLLISITDNGTTGRQWPGHWPNSNALIHSGTVHRILILISITTRAKRDNTGQGIGTEWQQ
jgi:hypothetical protein